MFSKTISKVALAVCSAFVAASAGAAIIEWDFTTGVVTEIDPDTYFNARSMTVSGVEATASAWSNTADQNGTSNIVIQSAYLGLYGGGGLGVTNRDAIRCNSNNGGDRCELTSPEHAVDNDQRFDSVRISFGPTPVNLTNVAVGYVDDDADITVLASNGAALDGRTYGGVTTGLVAAGWTLIGNYANLAQNTLRSISNTAYATDWLIIAYHPDFGSGENLSEGNDHFKLKLVQGDTRQVRATLQVPEPGTLLLLGAALVVIWWRRRVGRR